MTGDPYGRPSRTSGGRPDSFGDFGASELWCDRCRAAQPVRRHLLLVLPSGDKYVYRCAACGHEVGEQTNRGSDNEPGSGGIIV